MHPQNSPAKKVVSWIPISLWMRVGGDCCFKPSSFLFPARLGESQKPDISTMAREANQPLFGVM